MMKEEIKTFQAELLKWYHKNKRCMPWREEPTPYHVWISEIMLQQTRVEAVRAYYLRFIEKLPDIKSLSEVTEDELHKLWEGLGYYNRAKNLKKTAGILMEGYDGELPSSYEELLKLPGIGPYTAGAIASIAFHKAVPALDGNVMRVISRVTGDCRDIMKLSTRKAMEDIVQTMIPTDEVHYFNQALMELGALICIPNGSPKCKDCPVRSLCFAYKTKKQAELPVKKAKKDRKVEKRSVLVFVNEKEEILIQKRSSKGLLSGLWEFVSLEGEFSIERLGCLLEQRQIYFEKIIKIESSKHVFSHIEWHMEAYMIKVDSEKSGFFGAEKPDQFYQREDLRKGSLILKEEEEGYGFSSFFRKERLWCDFITLKEKYSIPAAFKAYLNSIEMGRVREELGLKTN